MYIPTFEDMLEAHERIKPHINRTPVLTSAYLDELTGAQLFFKCENFQTPGAFKVRGASNAVFGLNDEYRVHVGGEYVIFITVGYIFNFNFNKSTYIFFIFICQQGARVKANKQ